MNVLGCRLRYRRRAMGLTQKEVAGQNSASFLSKVETGTVEPSLKTLRDWALLLDTTVSSLIGDELILKAAKLSILEPSKCHFYLALLPTSPQIEFLRRLSTSARSLSTEVPIAPQDPELMYLTARVFLQRGSPTQAESMAQAALALTNSPLWSIYCLTLLCQVYDKLSEPEQKKQTEQQLQKLLSSLDPEELFHTFPEDAAIPEEDIQLLQLSLVLNPLYNSMQ